MNSTSSHEQHGSFPPIVTAIICIAALYFARAVLVPISLAILLSFLLAPAVRRLERWHLGRTGPVIVAVVGTILVLVALGWVVGKQAINLAGEIPHYSDSISKKIEAIRGVKNGGLGKAASTVNKLGTELSQTIQAPAANSGSASRTANDRSALSSAPANRHPVPVEVVASPESSVRSLRSLLGPVLGPIATIGIVIVFATFMLLRREDLRDRLFTLAGLNRIHVTRQAFGEAANRVVRYLWIQSLVNLSFGAVIGVVLYFIGLPNALLWGVLAGVLRFIPYIGTLIGAALPIILSFALFAGWTRPLLTLGIFVVLEVVSGYFIEPLLYEAHTGISSLAILVAAVFWAALWGPVGLLLSTPLTVCLVVMGHYIPQLEFLTVLLGDRSVLATDVQLYQSLSALDIDEAQQVIEKCLHEKSLREVYDTVFIPVLILAERSKHDAAFGGNRSAYLFQELKRIVEDLAVRYTREHPRTDAPAQVGPSEQILLARSANAPAISVCCLATRDGGDEVTGMMLAHLLVQAGYDAHAAAMGPQQDMLDEVEEQVCGILYLSALPPFEISSIRRLYKRLRSRFPQIRIGIGLWGYDGEADNMRALLRIVDSDLIVTTLGDAIVQIQQFTELAARSR
ncbi:MAG TPA: AI-2E family transporter [Candidatus Acidoferrales bacterium]|nr:AI-2E family transporter [Candidatus Acidoferrales bacterium]